MHYKNGREAKVGDDVIVRQKWEPKFIAGTVVGIYPGSDTCNLSIVPKGTATFTVTASDALHVEDADLCMPPKGA